MHEVAPLVRARQLIQSGALAEAGPIVRWAAATAPGSAVAMTLAAQIAMRRAATGDAVRYFTRAALIGGTADCRTLLNLARAQEMAGLSGAALATTRGAVDRFPDDFAARGLLALLLAAAGDLDAAVAFVPRGGEAALDAATAYRIAWHLKTEPRHRARAMVLFLRCAVEPGRHAAAARSEALSLAAAGDAERLDVARRLLAADPADLDVVDAAVEELGPIRKLVRQAAWAWQSCCLDPADRDRLRRAAELTWAVKWPRHGIAANIALLGSETEDLELIGRITRLHGLSKDAGAAVAWGESLLAAEPRHPRVWNLVALMYKDVGAIAECDSAWSRTIRRYPMSPQLRYNHALFLENEDRLTEAETQLRRSAVLDPGYARVSNQLSLVNNHLNCIGRAQRLVEWSIAADPWSPNGYQNRGMYLRRLGDYGNAIAAFAEAERRAAPGSHQEAAGRYNTAMVKVNLGEIGEGFRLAESRWALNDFPSSKRNFRQPIWLGPHRSPDSALLLYLEQGLGDELMLTWYLPLVRRDVRRLVVDCDERLIPVLSRTFEGIDFVPKSMQGDPRTRDSELTHKVPSFHVPQHYVAEVKALIHRNWDWAERQGSRFPARLAIEPGRLERWRLWLDARRQGRPAVGICWRSGHRNRHRNPHYMSVAEIAACIPPDTLVVNLQYSWEEQEVEALGRLARQHGFEFVTPDGVDLKNDLDDVMALAQTVDATVSATTAVAWMAGAVGCPTWMFSTSGERMFWPQLGTPFIPWAPSMRIFRRDPSEPWGPTIADIRATATRFLGAR